jgi:hypothetical protein
LVECPHTRFPRLGPYRQVVAYKIQDGRRTAIRGHAELVSRIILDAEAIMRERFEAMMFGGKRQAAAR